MNSKLKSRNKKRNIKALSIFGILVAIISIGIGYSYLSTSLGIFGNLGVKKHVNATVVGYDNTNSGLEATTVQEALDKIAEGLED